MKVLITGGASGLGKAITERLVQQKDFQVIITYRSSAQKAQELENKYTNVRAVKCDFSNDSDLTDISKLIQEEGIGILINNAHSTKIDKNYFHKLSADVFAYGFHQNILPVIRITQAAINIFRKKRYGKIITILSSSIANKPPTGYSEYTASKGYLLSLSKSWATENVAFNITSNCISPAFMLTQLTHGTDERIIEEMQDKHPLKRLLIPEEVADVVAFLCNSTQQINGVNMIVNSAENVV